MLRLKNLTDKYQKRLIRPLYAQTQATPYAATLDTTFRNTDGSINLPLSGDTTPTYTRVADAHTTKNSLTSGVVMVRTIGEHVAVATGPDDGTERPFGLLANFVGGNLDDIGDENNVGVWRGAQHAVFELLAPAFDDTGLAAAYAAAGVSKGLPVNLYAGTDGRLVYVGSPNANRIAVARLIERVSASRIVIELLV